MIKDDWKPQERSIEYQCVQDSDLLDAIGSIGVARCYAFGEQASKAALYSRGYGKSRPYSRGIQEQEGGSGVEHFFEKLLLIRDLMITDTGKEIAKTRHRAMVQFLENLSTEIADADEDASEVLTKRLRQF